MRLIEFEGTVESVFANVDFCLQPGIITLGSILPGMITIGSTGTRKVWKTYNQMVMMIEVTSNKYDDK